SDVVVIHPGSRNLYIGRASDAFPKEIPQVIVRRTSSPSTSPPFPTHIRISPAALEPIEADVKARLRALKIRTQPSSHAQVKSYNAQAVPETILDHNDSFKVDWVEFGNDALRIPILSTPPPFSPATIPRPPPPPTAPAPPLRAFYPIQHGLLNTEDYTSIRACLADLQTIWTESIEEELSIPRANFSSCSVVLVIPDLFSKTTVREMIGMLVGVAGERGVAGGGMGFRGLLLIQESVSASFGAGMSTTCVVDIGAQKTSIACVEDGLCVPDTRINLKYGGDDVTAFLRSLLVKNDFPYRELDVEGRVSDWLLTQELKEKFCTVNEVDMIVNVYDFQVRAPDRPTLMYRFKMYDEIAIAPMVCWGGNVASRRQIVVGRIRPLTPTRMPPPMHFLRRRRALPTLPDLLSPLDLAVSRSIELYAHAYTDIKERDLEDRVRRLCASILLVGGGARARGIGRLLADRVGRRLAESPLRAVVLESPREMDPRFLCWKGASIYAKLDMAGEMWIGRQEWEFGGVVRVLGKMIFGWD
ncbi:hypothetical protein BDK51DRAFT_16475, partial [Blyttiomyces helicus]